MADIDQIIAGGAGSTSRADFSALADIPEAYWKGKDRQNVQQTRDLFKGGVPPTPDGSVNYGAMRDALFQAGNVDKGVALDNLSIQRDQLKLGQTALAQSQSYETGQPQSAPILPPSANRSASTPVAPPISRGGALPQNGAAPQPAGGTNILQILDAQGIPNDQLGVAGASIGRQLGVDPSQPIDINDPRVRNVLVPAIQQLKRAGVGNITPPGQATPAPQVLTQGGPGQQAPPQPAPQPPPQAPQGQPGPVTNATTGTAAPAVPSRVDQGIALYAGQMANSALPQPVRDAAKARLEFLQKQNETTPEQKNYIQAKLEGFKGTMAEFAVKSEEDKTYAAENTKSYIKKYDAITKAGAESAQELPKLALAKQVMANPDFYTGPAEGINLAYKRILATIDPSQANAAQPQEAFRKIISDSVRSQIRSLAESGVGRISIPEVRIIEKAAANQENTPAANRLLVELSTRMHQQTLGLDELARNYNGGRLNPGFDTAARSWIQQHPIVTPAELKDPRIIAPPVFANGDAVRKAGLPKGSPFQTSDGRTKYVP